MKRGSVPFAFVLVLTVLLGACVQSAELNPTLMSEDEIATFDDYVGNIRVETVSGLVYKAQTLKSAEGDSLVLVKVDVIDDGVVSHALEVSLAKSKVTRIEMEKSNKWVVGGGLAGISLLILVLYYHINGSF